MKTNGHLIINEKIHYICNNTECKYNKTNYINNYSEFEQLGWKFITINNGRKIAVICPKCNKEKNDEH